MTRKARELLDEALTLVPGERADVAAELLASLDEPPNGDRPETAEAWAAEIERRARRVLSGQSSGEPWEVVRARVARHLSER
jgi:putative addiction module component (TIGR02574 family)